MTTTTINPTLVRRCIAEINAEPVSWLWPSRLPTKLIIIAGHPGMGKSQISISIAATVSVGGRWPDSTPCEQGSVIFICGEDDPGDTIKPRLEAAGAETKHVHVIDAVLNEHGKPRQWQLEDHEVIEKLILELGDVRLIVIDPVTAYVGKKDGHSTSDVRGLLAPLMELASREKVAILGISHLNKASQSEAMSRVTGSMAYVAASRAAYVVGRHPTDENARCLAPLKNNLGDDKTGFGYRVVSATSQDGFDTSRIEWIPGAIEVSADEILSKPTNEPEDIDSNSAKGDAAAFLIDILKNGPVPSKEVYVAADAADIAEATLKRAKKALLIKSDRIDGKPGWHMKLPDRKQGDQKPPTLILDPLDTVDPLHLQEDQGDQEYQGSSGGQSDPLDQSSLNSDYSSDGNLYPEGWGNNGSGVVQ